tara:strand:- start:223 stop:402 length:180 start_codon:yes stop_codon:yes gene_type:complete
VLDVNGELILPVYVYPDPVIEPVTKDPDIEPVRYVSGNSYLSQDGNDAIITPVPNRLLI